MSTEAKDIVAAAAMIDGNDKTQWEANGLPKLKAIQTLVGDKTVTAEQVAAALTPVEQVVAAVTGAKPEEPVDVSKLDRNSPEYAKAVVATARKEHDAIVAAITEQEAIRDEAIEKISQHRRNDDQHIRVIEQYGPKVSEAEAIKAIQKQTILNLARQKDAATIVASAIQGSGATIHPSKLDASLANRKRTPEQAANYAQYIHQRQREQTA